MAATVCFAWDLILLEEEGGDFLPYKSVTAVQSASICGKEGQTRFPGNLRTYFLYFAEELGRRNSFQPATKCLFELHNFHQSNLLSILTRYQGFYKVSQFLLKDRQDRQDSLQDICYHLYTRIVSFYL